MSLYEGLCLRSRSLLHHTLLKDDNRSTSSLPLPSMALASPPATPGRLVSAPMSDYSPRHQHQHPRPERLFSSPASVPRRTHTRDSSRSTTDHHLITPHEQVLRTRLERVLFSANDDRERGRSASSLNGSTRTVRRSRASTDPNIPQSPPPTSSHFPRLPASSPTSKRPSPVRHKKRTSTGRSTGSASGSGSASCYGSASAKRSTPPLVPDFGDHDEPRLLLLTPPSTPSPPAYGFYPDAQWSQCYRNPRDDEDDDDDDDDDSCSSYSSYREPSSIPHPHHHFQLRTPTSPHSPLRPFNARRASAQCRAMEGYVSFANVEGLGVPDEPPSPHPNSQDKGSKGVLTALGWGGGVVRKILGGATEKQEDGPVVY